MFMEIIFTEIDCSNIQPTSEEIASLNLQDHNYAPLTKSDSSISDSEDVHPEEVLNFEDFSTKPPENLLRRSARGSIAGTIPPHCRRVKVVHPHKYDLSRLSQPQK
ncbi:hypothetical protein EJD97_017947 [Solanum chilense]|uniref:Uncharacterized protein n=1 Tax=Solanum chilense TaxID=4083 RepID=A0A6N2B4I2_SOLCI|nr:hypothetical protein EJD97_017947 [Solanum chilense]